MATLLIIGSEKADVKLLQYTHFIVSRAKANDFSVICGDYIGVESQCWYSCQELDVPCVVYGIQNIPRNNAPIIDYRVIRPARTPEQRTQSLVKMADKVIGIWNGQSQEAVYAVKCAIELGKEAWLYGIWKERGIRNLMDNFDEIVDKFLKTQANEKD